ncbi:M48 family metallopeptidase [Rahnella woolbedingensis]|uniref:Metalloprotease n=1 Tax=Rahnella woolbedingensis TaxID=1510574 RepID=A0A419N5P8_9GAMM|nr:M48 family metallopeptidase [Rahnella woolbedingensis]RJT41573.1 metalloprotease [Rahnella woolbedingensis]
MNFRLTSIALGVAVLLSGCQNGALNTDAMMRSGSDAYKAATLTDQDVINMTDGACKAMDGESQIASSKSKYTKRLNKIAKNLGNNINGTPANYKVYITSDVNAWAMANGCIRVYSGLMDMMTDDEVEGVLGHEMGHVALGHTKKAMQVAYSASAAHNAAGAAGGIAGQLSSTQLADLGEDLINAQFSQKQESDADDYSYDLLKKRGLPTKGLVTAFEKLAKMSGGSEKSLFSSHPPSQERADHIKQRIAANK